MVGCKLQEIFCEPTLAVAQENAAVVCHLSPRFAFDTKQTEDKK